MLTDYCVSDCRLKSCVSAVNASLKIVHVQAEDAGQYSCEVTALDHSLVAKTYLQVHGKFMVSSTTDTV